MGFTEQGGSIVDLVPEPESVDRLAERIVDRVGKYMHVRVTLHSPVAETPEWADNVHAYTRERGGRRPGTLKRSWRIGTATFDETGASVDIYTDDPIAPFVEWDTRPHLIVPRNPGGVLRFRTKSGQVVFAKLVHHPGTKGQHMMATTLAETAVQWQVIAREEVARWAREESSR